MLPNSNKCILGGSLALALLIQMDGAQAASQEKVLHSFTGGSDGGYPFFGSLIADGAGNLYGTAPDYGATRGGTVFKITPKGKETVLYSFCSESNCVDGAGPIAGVIADSTGNLYGTTNVGGAANAGTVFKVTPKGRETVLYSFCSATNCTDGAIAEAGLIADSAGNLYGTTGAGGSGAGGSGTVFKVTPKGKETVLYSFCSATNCTDGSSPWAGLITDSAGNLYGTTTNGGAARGGTVFKVTPKGEETVLYSFCSAANCTDGEEPLGGSLIADSAGNLYGTTGGGGAGGSGTVFKLTPKGKETVLYSFCSAANCTDGSSPWAGLIADSAGNLYGTTAGGGAENDGTVFKLTPKGNETVPYSFCSATNCTDGANPYAGLLADGAGNLYGTTNAGGTDNYGTVFKITAK